MLRRHASTKGKHRTRRIWRRIFRLCVPTIVLAALAIASTKIHLGQEAIVDLHVSFVSFILSDSSELSQLQNTSAHSLSIRGFDGIALDPDRGREKTIAVVPQEHLIGTARFDAQRPEVIHFDAIPVKPRSRVSLSLATTNLQTKTTEKGQNDLELGITYLPATGISYLAIQPPATVAFSNCVLKQLNPDLERPEAPHLNVRSSATVRIQHGVREQLEIQVPADLRYKPFSAGVHIRDLELRHDVGGGVAGSALAETIDSLVHFSQLDSRNDIKVRGPNGLRIAGAFTIGLMELDQPHRTLHLKISGMPSSMQLTSRGSPAKDITPTVFQVFRQHTGILTTLAAVGWAVATAKSVVKTVKEFQDA